MDATVLELIIYNRAFDASCLRPLACVSKHFNKLISDTIPKYKSVSTTPLHKKQILKLDELVRTWSLPRKSPIYLVAPMGFGKTLVALRFAEYIINKDNAAVLVVLANKSFTRTWSQEVEKHFQSYLPRLVSNRRFLIYMDSTKKYVDEMLTLHSDFLKGRIIVITNILKLTIPLAEFGLIICDEIHKNAERNSKLFKNPSVLFIGANRGETDTSTAHELVINTAVEDKSGIHIQIIRRTSSIDVLFTMQENIMAAATKYKYLVAVTNSRDTTLNVGELRMFNFTTRTKTAYNKFVKNGGLLWGTVDTITEGVNILHCHEYHIQVRSEMSVDRLRQLMHRVIRRPREVENVRIFMYVYDDHAFVSCKLAQLNCDGIGLKKMAVNRHFDKISWNTITDAEILTIFGIAETPGARATVDYSTSSMPLDVYRRLLI